MNFDISIAEHTFCSKINIYVLCICHWSQVSRLHRLYLDSNAQYYVNFTCHTFVTFLLQSFPCLHNNLHLGFSLMIFALPFSENPIILFHFQVEKSHQTPKILFFAMSISWEFPMWVFFCALKQGLCLK